MVLSRDRTRNSKHTYVNVKCDCGVEKSTMLQHLKSGRTLSCGCLKGTYNVRATGRELEYQSWCAMLARCYNQNAENFRYYGAKGITVCVDWRINFDQFYYDMGPRHTAAHTLERENVNLPYQPDNCVWATRKVQSRNQNRTKSIEYNGQMHNVAELCDEHNVEYMVFYSRVFVYGWAVEEALKTPKMAHGGYYKYRSRKNANDNNN
jgi:hypothetical protein